MKQNTKEQKHRSRAELSLENCIRCAFHPLGNRQAVQDFIEEMTPSPRSPSILDQCLTAAGSTIDIMKYVIYTTGVGGLAYKFINTYL